MPTKCTITGTVVAPDGLPVALAQIEFGSAKVRPMTPLTIAPESATATTDEAGALTVELYPGEYSVRAMKTGRQRYPTFSITVPEAASAVLADIIDLPPPVSLDAAGQAVLAAQHLRDEAAGFASDAEAAEFEAGEASGQAIDAAGVALGAAGVATGKAGEAADSAAAALASKNAVDLGALDEAKAQTEADRLAAAGSATAAGTAAGTATTQAAAATTAKTAAELARDAAIAASVAANGKLNLRTSQPTSGAQIADIRLVPFDIARATVINRITGRITVADTTAKLFEIGIYSSAYAILARSGVREATPVGDFTIALPETTLQPGRYFFGITTDSTTLRVAVNEYAGGENAAAAFPLPASAAAPALVAVAPSVVVKEKFLPPVQGLFLLETGRNIRVYGQNGSQPWGLNTTTFNMAVSVDSGATFSDRMTVPPGALTTGEGIADLIVHGGKIYVLTNTMTLHESSDLTAGATWTDISCPISSDLRSANGRGRPYGIGVIGGHLFIGEYTNSPDEVRTTGQTMGPDPTRGPRIFRFDLTARTWALSAEFLRARHIHSFFTEGTSALWVSMGDAGWGTQIGLHRITPSGIGTGAGGTDSWLQWTTPVAPRTDHYPVDFVVAAAASFQGESFPLKFLMTSDRPGAHLLEAARSGTVAGSANIGVQSYRRPGGSSGETVRSLVVDPTNGNAFYWTAETSEPGIYVSPPPYNQWVRLADHNTGNLYKSVYSAGYVMMFDTRFRVEKFDGQ